MDKHALKVHEHMDTAGKYIVGNSIALDTDFNPVNARSPDAVRWNAFGAILYCYDENSDDLIEVVRRLAMRLADMQHKKGWWNNLLTLQRFTYEEFVTICKEMDV